MGRRGYGVVRCFLILVLDGMIVYYISQDYKIAFGIVLCVALITFWGTEVFAPICHGAIRMDHLDALTKCKLQACTSVLFERYNSYLGKEKNHITVYLIPDDCEVNAYAFGFRKIGVSSGALDSLDNSMMIAALSHELGHIVALDICVKRLWVLNGIAAFILFTVAVLAWEMVGGILCLLAVWLFGSCMGMWIGIKMFEGVQKMGGGILKLALCAGQKVMAILERNSEYRADSFAAEMGYGYELIYVLERYDTKTKKRIARLERKMSL